MIATKHIVPYAPLLSSCDIAKVYFDWGEFVVRSLTITVSGWGTSENCTAQSVTSIMPLE